MDTTPGATPETTLAAFHDSHYHSRTMVITVSPSRVPFSIHEAKLRQTCFFEVHTPLSKDDRNELHSRSSTVGNIDNQMVKSEVSAARIEQQLKADYHVEDRFFISPDAFDVFAKYLYNEPPIKPDSHAKVKVLLKAYGIAMKYKCHGLQNKVISCLQQYYSSRKAKLDDLVWCTNRFGYNTRSMLNAYLVEQIAFEIADEGWGVFMQANPFTKTFIEQGDRAIRVPLFQAIVKYTVARPFQDPARDKNKFLIPQSVEILNG